MAQCHATSKATRQQCKRAAIMGATVCRVHGGSAPQVREAARLRLLELVDPALAAMVREMRRETDSPNRVAVAAARYILDRAGLAADSAADAPAAQPSVALVIQDLRDTNSEG